MIGQLASMLLSLTLAYGQMEWWQQTEQASFKERCPLMSKGWGDVMKSRMITVPSRPNKIAYVCFKLEGKVFIECLYIDNATGDVYSMDVLPLEKDT